MPKLVIVVPPFERRMRRWRKSVEILLISTLAADRYLAGAHAERTSSMTTKRYESQCHRPSLVRIS